MNNKSIKLPTGEIISYVTITPEMATHYLDANTRNRRQRVKSIAQYTRSLLAGDWPFTGDAIRVSTEGVLLDGQHRLLAIEASGKPMPCLLIENLAPNVQKYLDSGSKRTVSDQLSMAGVSNATNVGSFARLLLMWGHWREGKGEITLGNNEIIEFAEDFVGPLQYAANVANNVASALPGASRQAIGTAYVRALQVTQDPFLVSNFFTRLQTGEHMALGDPIYALRNTLLRGELGRTAQLWMIVRAWNAEVKGEGIGRRTISLPRGGVTVSDFPDMCKPEADSLTELDEQAAELLQQLKEKA